MESGVLGLTLLTLSLFFPAFHTENSVDFQNVTTSNAPFTVIVLCTNSMYFCSGVIVDKSWVLTAAHCFHDLKGELTEDDASVMVVAGTSRLADAEKDIKSDQAQIRKSTQIHINEHYKWEENFKRDIALIKLLKPFDVSDRVAVVPLVKKNVEYSHDPGNSDYKIKDDEDNNPLGITRVNCHGYGFGQVSSEEDTWLNDRIKGQNYLVDKHCHCLERVHSSNAPPFELLRNKNFFICGKGYEAEAAGLCAGDNGGPLICNGVLRGIPSALFQYSDVKECKMLPVDQQVECGGSQSLNVFTDLCYFGKWLNTLVRSYPVVDDLCRLNQELNMMR